MVNTTEGTPRRLGPETTTEPIIEDWLNAVEEFARWKQQLDSLMNAYEATPTKGQCAKNPVVVAALRALVCELTQMMNTLLSQTERMERRDEPPCQS